MSTANAVKISATVPSHLVGFMKTYKIENHLRSDSEVISIALKRLEKSYLEICYAAAAKEIETNQALLDEAEMWDNTAGDDIDSEDW